MRWKNTEATGLYNEKMSNELLTAFQSHASQSGLKVADPESQQSSDVAFCKYVSSCVLVPSNNGFSSTGSVVVEDPKVAELSGDQNPPPYDQTYA